MSDSPTKTTSEETDERFLELARAEGEAYQRSFRHMAQDVANSGEAREAGDYVIGYAQESAEGMYRPTDGDLEWVEPSAENCHIEVAVADVADGRFVPELPVSVTFTASDGEEVGPVDLPFIWHPGLYHYGANVTLPGDGTYELRVEVGPAPFARHDETNGDRYAEPIAVVFEDVDVKCGQN